MALTTQVNPSFVIGVTDERPPAPAESILWLDKTTGTAQIYDQGVYRGLNPTFSAVTSLTALKALSETSRYNGLVVLVNPGNANQQQLWYFNSTSELTGDDILVATPTGGTGRWLRVPGAVDLALPIAYNTTSGSTLWTVPAGARFKIRDAYWRPLSAFTGGSSAALGLSSTNMTGLTTKGDILGGASGDVLATLITGVTAGTIGVGLNSVAKLHTSTIMIPTMTVRLDGFTDAFTGGTGYAHLVGDLLLNAGV